MRVEFLNDLLMRELPEGTFELHTPFYCAVVNDDGSVIEVIVPRGMVTDLCSVPRMPFAYLLFGGVGNKAGVLHDALYSPYGEVRVEEMQSRRNVEVTREWADAVLYAALKACGVGWQAWWMYKGVRLFGWQFYRVKDAKSENQAS